MKYSTGCIILKSFLLKIKSKFSYKNIKRSFFRFIKKYYILINLNIKKKKMNK